MSPDRPDKSSQPPWSAPIRVRDLKGNAETRILLRPESNVMDAIAAHLGLLRLRKLSFVGSIGALGAEEFELKARLGATIDQPCVVSLAPVRTRIDELVSRRFGGEEPDYEAGSETEIPEDVDIEPLADVIDPGLIMVETLALALPLFPRAKGAELQNATFTEPGKSPLSDEDVRPFAGLRSLRDKLSGDDPETDE